MPDNQDPCLPQALAELETLRQRIRELEAVGSEVRTLEALLRQSHEELRAIYDGMVEGLVITDIATKQFLHVNASLCKMLGYTDDELLAASIKDIHSPEELSNDLLRFEAAAEGRCSINEDRPVLRKDGTIFYADISGHRILYNERPSLLALFRDVTERRQVQAIQQRERRTLEHLLRAPDHERQLIAYDIHDGLAQQLAGALMQFQVFAHLKDTKPCDAQKAFDAGATMLRQSHFEARRLISFCCGKLVFVFHPVMAVRFLRAGQLKGVKVGKARGVAGVACGWPRRSA